jgi:hypothetical protein
MLPLYSLVWKVMAGCWLIYCERKTLLAGRKNTADKTSKRAAVT